jgi:nitrous oxidase accessory protein NosD
MNKIRFTLKAFAFLAFVFAFATAAQAQATRTWVSGVGDDVNPCSRTAPCKTYAGAISKTAAGGEISTLDPGGFGAVTTTKSIVIEGTHGQGYGSILASSVNGVNVNDSLTGSPGSIVVSLRNLSINGAGTTLGLNGVNFTSGRSLSVEDCVIQNFSQNGVRLGFGATPAVSPQLTIRDTIFRSITADGVVVQTTAAGQTANVRVINSAFIKTGGGVHMLTGARGVISNSTFNNLTGTGVALEAGAEAFVDNNVISQNANGVSVTGAGTNAKLCNNTIVRNTGAGVLFSASGSANSCQDNKIIDNGSALSGGAFGALVGKS